MGFRAGGGQRRRDGVAGGGGGAEGLARLVGWWAGGPIGRNIQLETALMCCVRNALRTSWNRLLEKG